MAALAAGTAFTGFIAGAAVMGSYVAENPPQPSGGKPADKPGAVERIPVAGEAVKRIGTPVHKQVCRVTDLPGPVGSVPVVSQMGKATSAVVDVVGGVTGAGTCGEPDPQRA